MKVIILAGGLGTRLQEETVTKPKTMVEIGNKPILWHIISGYASCGFREFVIALGYKGEYIKNYFVNYYTMSHDLTVRLHGGQVDVLDQGKTPEDWTVHLIDTGALTQTGGRLKRLQSIIGNETFMMTYSDGVSNIDINALLAFHRSHGRLATMTIVHPAARFGAVELQDNAVTHFREKPRSGEGWINGGFFVLEPGVFDYLEGDSTIFERDPLERLAADGQLMAYQHEGFWQCMDNMRDVRTLEDLWQTGDAPWKTWEG